MSFDKNSNFNREANFQTVKFGENKPVLEVELNELQEIQNEARADIIRDSIPSGFTNLGELDYDYMLNNENQVRLKSDSVAYVNGYRINIPKDTIINIGKAPEKDPREDFVFLEVWKEEVNKDSTLYKNGGEGQPEIPNAILDSRYPVETTRRIALKWRIRVIPNVDFKTYSLDGFFENNNNDANKFNPSIIAQGGNSDIVLSPTLPRNQRFMPIAIRNRLNDAEGNKLDTSDIGVYIAGLGNSASKTILNTIDGYVYAIPMFRLYRRPSCGKAIPFEYNKINPLVDYTKFNALMKEEKIERVVNETIEGNSLLNLVSASNFEGVNDLTVVNDVVTISNTMGINEALSKGKDTFKPSTEYTIIIDVLKFQADSSSNLLGINSVEMNGSIFKGTIPSIKSTGVYKYKLTTRDSFNNTDRIFNLVWDLSSSSTSFKIMVLEGDWLNKELPEYFNGLKSLGEDKSLIVVKNSILNTSSYDPSTGNTKLNTTKGVNYITSHNLIVPTIEAQVKRGNEKLSDLNVFSKLDDMQGNEIIEFSKIKGKTIQNLVELSNAVLSSGVNREGDTFTLTTSVTNLSGVTFKNALTSTNKTYTVLINVLSLFNEVNGVKVEINNGAYGYLGDLKLGLNVFKIVTEGLNTTGSVKVLVRRDIVTGGEFKFNNVLVLEGDYTGVPLNQIPYVDGIKSVGENDNNKIMVQVNGKNLFNNKWKIGRTLSSSTGEEYAKEDNVCSDFIKVTPSSNIVSNKALNIIEYDINKKFRYFVGLVNEGQSRTLKANTEYIRVYRSKKDYLDAQIEEGTVTTPYEPYKEDVKEITLKEPLRSLPSGVADTIEGNKVIRRVGKVTFSGKADELWTKGTVKEQTVLFGILNWPSLNNAKSNTIIISDKFLGLSGTSIDIEGIVVGVNMNILISQNKLATQDIQGFKNWLSKNPTTVYYELEVPRTEIIEPNYDKESIRTYQLDEPLRSLYIGNNVVADEIKDGKLIRNCAEVIYKGSEDWKTVSDRNTDTTIFVQLNTPNGKGDNNTVTCICDKLPSISASTIWDTSQNVEGIGVNSQGIVQIRLLKSRLDVQSVDGFKNWLQSNPIKLIYWLSSSIETPLSEITSSKGDFSYKRQFKYDENYLLELPNGVKDTVENNKVIRRLKKLIVNGSENWIPSATQLTNTYTVVLDLVGKKDGQCISSRFPTLNTSKYSSYDNESIYSIAGGTIGEGFRIAIRVLKSRLATVDVAGFKSWLAKNSTQLIYELVTPVQEELSGVSNRYTPRHPINTYCGILYVGEGTNDVSTEGLIKSPSVKVSTLFRQGTNKLVVNDCNYKKHPNGLELVPSGKRNLVPNPTVVNTDKWTLKSNTSLDKNTLSPNGYNSFKVVVSGLSSPSYLGGMIDLQPNKVYGGRKYKVSCYVLVKDTSTVDEGIACELKGKKPGSSTIESIITIPKSTGLVNNSWVKFEKVLTIPNTYTNVYLSFFVIKNGVAWFSEFDVREINSDEEINAPFEDFILTQKAVQSVQKNDLEDLRHLVSLTGFNYTQMLNESFDKLLRGDL